MGVASIAEEGKVKKKQVRDELESYKRDGEAKSDPFHSSRETVFPSSDSGYYYYYSSPMW